MFEPEPETSTTIRQLMGGTLSGAPNVHLVVLNAQTRAESAS